MKNKSNKTLGIFIAVAMIVLISQSSVAEECENVPDRMSCLHTLAIETGDISYCEKLMTSSTVDPRGRCIVDVAKAKGDISICDKLSDVKKDTCIKEVAIKIGDVSVCNKINDDDIKNQCIAFFAKQKETCPFYCCVSESDYLDKLCSYGYSCVNHKCIKEVGVNAEETRDSYELKISYDGKKLAFGNTSKEATLGTYDVEVISSKGEIVEQVEFLIIDNLAQTINIIAPYYEEGMLFNVYYPNGSMMFSIDASQFAGKEIQDVSKQEVPKSPYCGDGTCNGDENCSNCEKDCGLCPEILRAIRVYNSTSEEVESKITQLKKEGISTSAIEKSLSEAKKEFENKNYETAQQIVSDAMSKTYEARSAYQYIEDARNEVNESKEVNCDTSEAENKIKDAVDALDKGNYSIAEQYAKEAVYLAKKANCGKINIRYLKALGAKYDGRIVEISGNIRDIEATEGRGYKVMVDDGTGIIAVYYGESMKDIEEKDDVFVDGVFSRYNDKITADNIEKIGAGGFSWGVFGIGLILILILILLILYFKFIK